MCRQYRPSHRSQANLVVESQEVVMLRPHMTTRTTTIIYEKSIGWKGYMNRDERRLDTPKTNTD